MLTNPAITNDGITGAEVKRLMRVYSVTIRELARRVGSTMKRIREVRLSGVGFYVALDFWQAISGSPSLTPELQAAFQNYRNQRPMV